MEIECDLQHYRRLLVSQDEHKSFFGTGRLRLTMFSKVIENQSGAIQTEYALLVTLVAFVCVAAVTLIGQTVLNFFNSVLLNS